jgi:hypothetical protein
MCINNLNNIKSSLKKEVKEIDLARQIKLINELGEPAHKFRIIDSLPMTPDRIKEFNLAIKTGVPGRPPKAKATNRPTIGDKYEIRYRYDLREGIDGPKILPGGRTRDFCTQLIDANRYYSRQDINTMDNGFRLSVFDYAGGWYTNPDTGETTPYCRHSFYMVFVEKK